MGTMKTHDGRSYHVKPCDGGHVMEEFDIQQFPDDQSIAFDGKVPIAADTTTVV